MEWRDPNNSLWLVDAPGIVVPGAQIGRNQSALKGDIDARPIPALAFAVSDSKAGLACGSILEAAFEDNRNNP